MEFKERWLWPYELNIFCAIITYSMVSLGLAVESPPESWGPLSVLRQSAPIYWASPIVTITIGFLMITGGIVAVELYARKYPKAKFVVYLPTLLCSIDFLWDISQMLIILRSLSSFA